MVVGNRVGVAHRVAHTTGDRAVTSEVERGSGALTPFDLARNTLDLDVFDVFKSRWGRHFRAFFGWFVTQGKEFDRLDDRLLARFRRQFGERWGARLADPFSENEGGGASSLFPRAEISWPEPELAGRS